MNDHARVVRVSRHFSATGRRDEVAGVLKAMADSMRDASGCFGAQVALSDRDPEQLILISRWESSDAMHRFHEAEDFTGFQRELEPSLQGAPDVEIFTTA